MSDYQEYVMKLNDQIMHCHTNHTCMNDK